MVVQKEATIVLEQYNSKDNGAELMKNLLFADVLQSDVKQFAEQDLNDIAAIAWEKLKSYGKKSDLIIDVQNSTCCESPTVVFTIVNDNKPFLFDSVQNVINYHCSSDLLLAAHPILNIKEKQGDVKRISLMQFVIRQRNGQDLKKIEHDIRESLADVNICARDSAKMRAEIDQLREDWVGRHAKGQDDVAKDVAEFLDWVLQDNFVVLAVHRYDLGKSAKKNSVVSLGVSLQESTLDDDIANADSDVLITKADQRSKVHRNHLLDEIRIFAPDRSYLLRIVGLFSYVSYSYSVFAVPYLKVKAASIIEDLGYKPEDHCGKTLRSILELYPRDEMFWLSVEELCANVRIILGLQERPSLRVLNHISRTANLVTSLVYLPKDKYNVSNCEKIGQYLQEKYAGRSYDYSVKFVNSYLTLVYYTIHRSAVVGEKDIEAGQVEADIKALVQDWEDSLVWQAQQKKYNREVVDLASQFPLNYRDSYDAASALEDATNILRLAQDKPLSVHFYHAKGEEDKSYVSLKLYHRGSALLLSERVPLLENMGFRVIDEQTFDLVDENGEVVFMHSMYLHNANEREVDLSDDGALLDATFLKIWSEEVDDDAFNRLCQTAKLYPNQVHILRIYGRYMQQMGIAYSQEHLAAALNSYSDVARDLYEIFYQKFALDVKDGERDAKIAQAHARIAKNLQKVPNIDDDLILRRYLNLLDASLRTNAFVPEKDGSERRIIAIKLNPRIVEGMPQPRPYREIFVYGAQVEGVHLRFGPVARGGIRWSDRALDYRTEVLGLVKAQQVKNVVIVPVGSKGGFYPRQLPITKDRAVLSEAARQAYIAYIDALLSLCDNLVDSEIVHPEGVRCLDGGDPYFVVAADKGTASFSDTANAISQGRDFWLDDAFASGGSAGYDHKKMGITAKGAWEAVKRHFRESMNRDIQNEDFTVVGVGDMSGDVFGNGMLLSKHIRLIAAFDHRDIFIDPNPDAATSYSERERLFNMDSSSWQDYDRSKLSKGGAIYSRSEKEITLSPEAAAAIGFDKQKGTPFEILSAILKADVDLLWFGGIGTYVRSSSETNSDVGDRGNDKIRVTGAELRAKIIGEGANLGMTQRGRIEYCSAGGRCNTDAIDNSAGVNCSDVEVNIKIAFSNAMRSGMLDRKKRDAKLKTMTNEVSQLVLRNNYRQSLLISLCSRRALQNLPQERIFISDLESKGLLDRKVELLPDDNQIKEKLRHGQGLTRPEISIIIAYAKLTLQEQLSKSDFINDEYFEDRLLHYFPSLMQKEYGAVISKHQLRGAIMSTILSNAIVNDTGPTFASRLADKADVDVIDIVKAYIYVYDGLNIGELISGIDALDNKIAGENQNILYSEVMCHLQRAISSFVMMSLRYGQLLKNNSIAKIVQKLNETFTYMRKNLTKEMKESCANKAASYIELGVDKKLAEKLSLLQYAVRVPNIVLLAEQEYMSIDKVVQTYFSVCSMFKIEQIEDVSHNIYTIDYYDDLAVSQTRDNIIYNISQITKQILDGQGDVNGWLEKKQGLIEDIVLRLNGLIEGDMNIARFVVASSLINDAFSLSNK